MAVEDILHRKNSFFNILFKYFGQQKKPANAGLAKTKQTKLSRWFSAHQKMHVHAAHADHSHINAESYPVSHNY